MDKVYTIFPTFSTLQHSCKRWIDEPNGLAYYQDATRYAIELLYMRRKDENV